MNKKKNIIPSKGKSDHYEDYEEVIHRQCQELDAWRDKCQELQKKLDSQIEGTSKLVKDCDAWREKYQKLQNQFNDLAEKEKLEAADYKELSERHETLKVACSNCEYELDRSIPASTLIALQKKYDDLQEECANMSQEMTMLRNRNKEIIDSYVPSTKYQDLMAKNNTLEMSNKSMEQGLLDERKLREDATKDYQKAREEVLRLKNRGLWARIFNR